MEILARLDLGVEPDSFFLDLSQEIVGCRVVDGLEIRRGFDANSRVFEFVDGRPEGISVWNPYLVSHPK